MAGGHAIRQPRRVSLVLLWRTSHLKEDDPLFDPSRK
jgi:hypothetical protein